MLNDSGLALSCVSFIDLVKCPYIHLAVDKAAPVSFWYEGCQASDRSPLDNCQHWGVIPQINSHKTVDIRRASRVNNTHQLNTREVAEGILVCVPDFEYC